MARHAITPALSSADRQRQKRMDAALDRALCLMAAFMGDAEAKALYTHSLQTLLEADPLDISAVYFDLNTAINRARYERDVTLSTEVGHGYRGTGLHYDTQDPDANTYVWYMDADTVDALSLDELTKAALHEIGHIVFLSPDLVLFQWMFGRPQEPLAAALQGRAFDKNLYEALHQSLSRNVEYSADAISDFCLPTTSSAALRLTMGYLGHLDVLNSDPSHAPLDFDRATQQAFAADPDEVARLDAQDYNTPIYGSLYRFIDNSDHCTRLAASRDVRPAQQAATPNSSHWHRRI